MLRVPLALASAGALASMLATLGGGRVGETARVRRQPSAVVTIPAGTFRMGSDVLALRHAAALCAREPFADTPFGRACTGIDHPTGRTVCEPDTFADEYNAHTVWLPAFAMDRTEVTVAAYDRCISAGACRPGAVALGAPQLGGATQPVVNVTWDDARAFCAWVGGRLPTEAEWERAARGRDGRPFPWGWQYDPRRANHGAISPDCYDAADGHAMTAPVGSYPDGASPDGLLDMAGNVWEWVEDFWDDAQSRYPERDDARLSAPRGATHGPQHVLRGGAWNFPAFGLRTAFRFRAGTGTRSVAVGFRCAYDP